MANAKKKCPAGKHKKNGRCVKNKTGKHAKKGRKSHKSAC